MFTVGIHPTYSQLDLALSTDLVPTEKTGYLSSLNFLHEIMYSVYTSHEECNIN